MKHHCPHELWENEKIALNQWWVEMQPISSYLSKMMKQDMVVLLL